MITVTILEKIRLIQKAKQRRIAMTLKIKKRIQFILCAICLFATFALTLGVGFTFNSKPQTARAASYTTKDVAMLGRVGGWHGNGNFEIRLTLGETDWTNESGTKTANTSAYGTDLAGILSGLDFFNKIKLGDKTLAEWGCTACYDNCYELNGGSPNKYTILIPLAMGSDNMAAATAAGIKADLPITILEGALIPSHGYLQKTSDVVYRAGCEFVSAEESLDYGIMSYGKTEVLSVKYVQGHDGTCGYFGVQIKGNDYGSAQAEATQYHYGVYTNTRYDATVLVNGNVSGKAKSYGLFNLGEKGKGLFAFQMYMKEEDMESITIPAGTTFPSRAMKNLKEATGNNVTIFYKTQTDVTFYKQPDGSWLKPLEEKETEVSSAFVDVAQDGVDNFTVIKLSNHDYPDSLGDWDGGSVKIKDFFTNHNFFTHVLVDDEELGSTAAAYLNIWGNKGAIGFRTSKGVNTTKITILAGCQFPTYDALIYGAREVYVTKKDVTFVKQPDGTWVEQAPIKETEIASAFVDVDAQGGSFTVLKLSNHDYPNELDNYDTKSTVVKDFLTNHNFFTHVLIDDVPLGSTGEAYLNVWGNKGAIGFRTSQGANATKITVLAGCQIPTYAGLVNETDDYYVTTEVVTFIKVGDKWTQNVDFDITISQGVQDGEKGELVSFVLSSPLWNFARSAYDYNYFGEQFVNMRNNIFINGVSLFEINTTVDDSSYNYYTSPQTNASQSDYEGVQYDLFANPTILYCKGTKITLYVHEEYIRSLGEGDITIKVGAGFQAVVGDDLDLSAVLTKDVEVVAFANYTVNIDGARQIVLKGENAIKPANPTKDMTETKIYTFDNWYIAGTNDVFDFGTLIEQNYDVESRFTETEVEIRRTEVIGVQYEYYKENGDTFIKIEFSNIDYSKADADKPIGIDEFLRLGTLDKIILRGQMSLNGKTFTEISIADLYALCGEGHDGPYVNLRAEGKLGIRVHFGGGLEEVTIEAGCFVPSFEKFNGSEKDIRYMVSNAVTFVYNSAENSDGNFTKDDLSLDFKMAFGASVRITSNTESSGLRFTTMVSQADVDKLKALISSGKYESISFGTIIVPTDYVVGGRLTHAWLEGSRLKYLDIKSSATLDMFNDDWEMIEDGYYCYYGSIVALKEGNYDRDFSAVGYIKFGEGEDAEYYYAKYDSSNSRSAAFVAKSAIEDRKDSQIGKYDEFIQADNNYSPYSADENLFLKGYVEGVWYNGQVDQSLVTAQEISALSTKGGTYEVAINQKLKGAYVELTYSTDVNIWGKFYYQNTSGSRTAVEDFYLQAGTSLHKQFLDIYRQNGVYWQNDKNWTNDKDKETLLEIENTENDLYLTKIEFTNAELEDCSGKFKLLGLYSHDKTIDIKKQEIYLTVGNMTVGAHLGLGGALTYLAKGGVYEGVVGQDKNSSFYQNYLGYTKYKVDTGKIVLQTTTEGFDDSHATGTKTSEAAYYGSTSSNPVDNPDSPVNLINNTDAGRQIQQAWYADVGDANGYQKTWCTTESESGKYWPYNPVQAGDVKSNPSQIIDYEITGSYIYVKSRAMDWAKGDMEDSKKINSGAVEGGVTTKSYNENYYRLNADGTLVVTNSFVDWNGFTNMELCDFANTELPAVYTIQSLNYYVTNKDGDGSWNDGLEFKTNMPYWGGGTEYTQNGTAEKIENWFAWANGGDLSSFGVGIYIPNVASLVSGRSKPNTSLSEALNRNAFECALPGKGLMSNMQEIQLTYKGAYISNTNYTAPVVKFRMEAYKQIEYSYVICVDTVGNIRNKFKDIEDKKLYTNAGDVSAYEKVGLDAWARADKSWTW